MISDWDGAYDNVGNVADSGEYPARWAAAAAAFRAGLADDRRRTGLAYGTHPRQRVDLFLPEGRPRGLLVFVHGGYWRRFDRGDFSHLASGPLGRGWAVAMPGYVLVPEARIAAIGAMVGRAIAAAAAAVPGPLRLAGHSAGGHLVARQVCIDSNLPVQVRARIAGALSISGVHDLRPLLLTAINGDLQMDPGEAAGESPALLEPLAGTRLHAWVGADELPEFVRQAALIANVWTGLGADAVQTVEPGRHHYDVIEALEDPGSALVAAAVGEG